ncbi:hypothetical protein FKW77_007267 [Venturia effusa]|uniref:Uncharacterized protein n=1 Tax=Venturia effusa TaxID=50376 RepID=A0A517LHJ6_9PEZI|nr:hypothetical protein FKW77_007267 [Venturia effusa]
MVCYDPAFQKSLNVLVYSMQSPFERQFQVLADDLSCQGLYRGYKLRNAKLDALVADPPKYLTGKKSLAARDFTDLEDEGVLREIHDHLFERYNLLDRVIRARRLHHSRFFVLDLDYGHELYLNQLNQQKFTVIRALERLEKRTAEVLYKKQKWFKWVRQCQDDEEKQAENEKEKIKREAALFRRQWKQIECRMRALRAKEEQKQQDAYLDKAYEERMLESDDAGESDWDPIEDFMDDKRGTYIDLIRHFLWSTPPDSDLPENEEQIAKSSVSNKTDKGQREDQKDNRSSLEKSLADNEIESAPKKKKKKNKKKDAAGIGLPIPSSGNARIQQVANAAKIPDKSKIETEEELRTRLSTPQVVQESSGPQVAGTIQNPISLMGHAPSLADDETDGLVSQIVEIKHLLFCRILLTHATLLPIALRSDSVDAFLANTEVSEVDLRDLCLQMEQPDLQQIRDACADLTREDEPDDPEADDEEDPTDMNTKDWRGIPKDLRMFDPRISKRGAIPETWKPKREGKPGPSGGVPSRRADALDSDGVMVDFGELDDKGEYLKKKMRVKICGRYIWNYASQSAKSRSGWLQFSVIAGNCSLFIQYLSMKSSTVCVLVRDGKDGRIVVKPPEDQLFLVREKSGRGRASKNEWTDIQVVGERFFEEMDQRRTWHFGFNDYYDVYVWDLCSGDDFQTLYRAIYETLLKARRATEPREMYLHLKPILSSLTRDEETARAREIRPNSDEVSIFEDMTGPDTRFIFGKRFGVSKPEDLSESADPAVLWYLFYNEADAMEDVILFPDEENLKVGEIETRISQFEREGPVLRRFVNDLDVDEHLSDYELSDDSSSEGGFLVRPGDDQDVAIKQLQAEANDTSDWSEDEGDENSMALDLAQESRFGWNRGISSLLLQASIADMGGPSADSPRISAFRKSPAYSVLSKWHRVNDIVNNEEADQDGHVTFIEWVERDRSKHFKDMFHACDLDPESVAAYNESMDLAKSIEQNEMGSLDRAEYCFLLLDFLGVQPGVGARRAMRDIVRAYAMIVPFFPGLPQHSITAFLESKHGKRFKSSKLFRPHERTQVPNQRSHTSNRYRDKSFWKEWQDIEKNAGSRTPLPYVYPREWDKLARPIIARWGEPFNRDRRISHPDHHLNLLEHAKSFASKNTGARFALLRIWSSPYFWPLMLGYDNRDMTAFTDGQERSWEFKFIPKDMGCSEWSIHFSVNSALESMAKPLGHVGMDEAGEIIHRRDIILVMGTDEEDLMRRVVGTTFAVQGRPWLREIDLARSFINVDEAFLDKLDGWWFD